MLRDRFALNRTYHITNLCFMLFIMNDIFFESFYNFAVFWMRNFSFH